MSTTANDPQRKDAVLTQGSQQPFFHQHQHDVYVSSGLRNGEAPVSQFLMAPLAQRSALQWMEPTELRCWHCTHGFDTTPYGIPIELSATNVYTMRGNFCSLECAKGFVTQEGAYNASSEPWLDPLEFTRLTGESLGVEPIVRTEGDDPDRMNWINQFDLTMDVSKARQAGFEFAEFDQWFPNVVKETAARYTVSKED